MPFKIIYLALRVCVCVCGFLCVLPHVCVCVRVIYLFCLVICLSLHYSGSHNFDKSLRLGALTAFTVLEN